MEEHRGLCHSQRLGSHLLGRRRVPGHSGKHTGLRWHRLHPEFDLGRGVSRHNVRALNFSLTFQKTDACPAAASLPYTWRSSRMSSSECPECTRRPQGAEGPEQWRKWSVDGHVCEWTKQMKPKADRDGVASWVCGGWNSLEGWLYLKKASGGRFGMIKRWVAEMASNNGVLDSLLWSCLMNLGV